MTFLIESLAACALFSLFVHLMSRDPVYPPAYNGPQKLDRLLS